MMSHFLSPGTVSRRDLPNGFVSWAVRRPSFQVDFWQPADDCATARCQRTRNVIRRTSRIARAPSETKIGLGRGFEAERNPGVDRNDRLASLGQRLVEQTLGVPERAGKRILRHDSATYLIRDEDNRTG